MLSYGASQPFPSTVLPVLTGIEAVAANPQGDLAVALAYKDEDDAEQDRFLFTSGGSTSVWAPPWQGKYFTMGLGWDGETFTASLMSSDRRWAAARLSPPPSGSGDAELFGHASANYAYFDSETDALDGTTVFAGASMPGIAVTGRRGRDKPLTSADGWHFSTGGSVSGWATAVAVNVPTALLAWAEKDIIIGEVSLDTGEVLQTWTLPIAPGDNVFEQVAAARVNDRWVIVAQDYRGLVMAEIRNGELAQRRVLHHPPAACAESDSCGMSSAWRWRASRLAVVKDGDLAWAGVLDESRQRVENQKTLFAYRMLALTSGCSYESLAP